MLKKASKVFVIIVGAIIAVICILVALLIALFIYIENKTTTITTISSEDKEYTIIVQNIGNPASFVLTETKGRFELKHKNKTISKYKFQLDDGGMLFTARNFTYAWEEDHVTINLKRFPYYMDTYVLYYNGEVDWITEGESIVDQEAYEHYKKEQNYISATPTPTASPAVDEQSIYDNDGVLIDDTHLLLKKEMTAIFEYLITEGKLSEVPETSRDNRQLSFSYSAKGELMASVFHDIHNVDDSKVYMNHTLVFNRSINNGDEFVYYENYTNESGTVVKSSNILCFFYVNSTTLEVTVDERTQW